jgi:hypothetical protein
MRDSALSRMALTPVASVYRKTHHQKAARHDRPLKGSTDLPGADSRCRFKAVAVSQDEPYTNSFLSFK